MGTWGPVNFEAACLRAGGRRRVNARRKRECLARRCEMQALMFSMPPGLRGWGFQTWLAGQLGVSKATISRYMKKYRAADWPRTRSGRIKPVRV